jgi:hypothetical protein
MTSFLRVDLQMAAIGKRRTMIVLLFPIAAICRSENRGD